MQFNINEMRTNHEAFQMATRRPGMQIRKLRVDTFNGTRYALLGEVRLRSGVQSVQVIDLDKFNAGPCSPVARFAMSWPEQGRFAMEADESPESIDERVRRYVLFITPDEGRCHLILEDGTTRSTLWSECVIQIDLQPVVANDRE